MVPRTGKAGLGPFVSLMAAPAPGQPAGMLGLHALVKNSNGDPVTGSVDLVCRIYDAKQAGNKTGGVR